MMNTSIENVYVVIPSLDPDEKLAAIVNDVFEIGFKHVLLVDDGSKNENKHFFPTGDGIVLLTHEINKGKGAALKTALSYLNANCPDAAGCVTADSDGQHTAKDIKAVTERMLETGHFVLGSRDFSLPDVPKKSLVGNRLSSVLLSLFCGVHIRDTQTGLRAMPASCFYDMTLVDGSRFEYETNVLLALGDMKLKYEELTIDTVYLNENKGSHFRPIRDSIRIFGLIIRYVLTSLIAFLIDIGIFTLLYNVVKLPNVLLATVAARVVSASCNFALNRRVVFRSRESLPKSIIKYAAVAIPIMLISGFGVTGLVKLFGLAEGSFFATLIKLIVDTILFAVNFGVQRTWVFKKK